MHQVNVGLLQPEPAAEPIQGRPGAVRPAKVQQMMVDVFQQADKELLQYLLGRFEFWCLTCSADGIVFATDNCAQLWS
jgi:hypothetical protein